MHCSNQAMDKKDIKERDKEEKFKEKDKRKEMDKKDYSRIRGSSSSSFASVVAYLLNPVWCFLPFSPDDEIIRLVSYVCMAPRKTCTEEVLESRQQAFLTRSRSNHWPNVNYYAESLRPGQEMVRPEECPTEMLRLVGYDV